MQRSLLTAALFVGVLLASLEVSILTPVLPRVATELGDAGLYPWTITGFLLASTLFTPAFGLFSDRFGRRYAYLLGLLLLLAGSAVGALAPSMKILVAARVLQGVGAAALLPLTVSAFGDLYSVEVRAKMYAWISLVYGVSTLVGPFVGATLTEWWSWRGAFWINLPPGLVAAVGVALWLPQGRRPAEEERLSWTRLWEVPIQRVINLCGPLVGAAFYGILAHVPVLVQGVEHGDTLAAGLAILPLSLAWSLSSHFTGRLMMRLGPQGLVHLGSICLATGTGISALWTFAQPGLILVGLGMGFLISSCNIASQETAPPALRGTAVSVGIFSRNMGSAFSVPLFGWLAGFKPGIIDFSQIPDLPGGLHRVAIGVFLCALAAALGFWRGFPKLELR